MENSSGLPRDIALIVMRDQDGKFLLIFRDGRAPRFPLRWGLFGGHLEDGEDPREAARREMEEEIGVPGRKEDFSYLGSCEATDSTIHAIAYTRRISLPEVRLGEGAGFGVFTEDELKRLDLAESAREVLSRFVFSKK